MGIKGGDHISRSKALKKEENNNYLEKSGSVKAENLTLIDGGGVDNLNESRTFNSQSLVVRNSDISNWHAAPQNNNGAKEANDLVENFCSDGLGGCAFTLEDLGFNNTDWMLAYQNSNQEEKTHEDSTNNKPAKKKLEPEENLDQVKKMRLE
ncbi:hypothetical protein POM88_031898 [Heracleum sosnowskyi]|uniref:Uncharacterized protein n=1 Tax=Heracleum sosnowskyi TaxID=360622 RepID=A0AAD8MH09_9APIA|nr:hypothetical protein POM88_031898 [Heracleum sosnowskyi]